MKRALIRPEACVSCPSCAVQEGCERNAVIRETRGDRPWIDFYRCAGCMRCVTRCPRHAVEEIAQPCSGGGRMSW